MTSRLSFDGVRTAVRSDGARPVLVLAGVSAFTVIWHQRLGAPPAVIVVAAAALTAVATFWPRIARSRAGRAVTLAALWSAFALTAIELVWRPPARLIVHGLAVGSLYGLLAIGVIIVYRSHRFINFAAGSMGAVPSVLALTLMATHGLSWLLAFPLAIAGGALLGGGTYGTVVRRFSRSPRLLLTVVTIGMSQLFAYLAFRIPTWLGGSALPPTIRTPLSDVRFCRERDGSSIGDAFSRGCHRLFQADEFNLDLVLAFGVVALASVGLIAFYRYTRMGVAARASAENIDRASLLGIPVGRVAMVTWAIAGALAATTIFVRAPLVGLPLGGLAGPSILLFALAAAVVARMESMPVALGAGMAIGVIDQSSVFATGRAAIATATMLVILLVAFAVRRQTAGRGGEMSSWHAVGTVRAIASEWLRLRAVRRAITGLACLIAAAAVSFPFLIGTENTEFATSIVISAIVAVSLVVLTGWAGQISLGQYGIVGIGALVAGALAGRGSTDLFVTLGAGTVAGALVAVMVGLPALRLPGLFQAVTTLAFSAAVEFYVLNPDLPIGKALLPQGADRVLRPRLWDRLALSADASYRLGWVDLSGDRLFYFLCLGSLTLVVASAWSFRRYRSGRVLAAVRDNPLAASSYAVHGGRTKLAAFALSGSFAGLAGVLLAYQHGAIDAATYGATESLAIFAATVVGGISSLGGAVLAAFAFGGVNMLERINAAFESLALLATGPGLVVVLWFVPGGLAEAIARLRDRSLRWLVARQGIPTDESAEDQPPPTVVRRRAITRGDDALLSCDAVEASYGNVPVLFGVDIEVREGEIVALLGTNGAGKSTLLKTISGLLDPSDGTIRLDGVDITGAGPVEMARRGVVHVPGGHAIFASLDVEQHLRLAAWCADDDPADAIERAFEAFPVLRVRKHQPAGTMSGGEQQMLALAMALVARPRVLLIDELSLGLDHSVVERLLDVVRAINAGGTTVVVVEQSLEVACAIAPRAYFLEKGAVRFAGPTRDLVRRSDIARSVFLAKAGKRIVNGGRRVRRSADDTSPLEIRGLRKHFGGIAAVDGVDLRLKRGSIVGLVGANGAGKTTIFDLVSGHLEPDEGQVLLDGVDVTKLAPHRRAAAGLGRSFQDSRIFPWLTVAENVAVGLERHIDCRDHLAAASALPAIRDSEAVVARRVDELIDLMGLSGYRDALAAELSTGTRHIVDMTMALAHRPEVLLLDEPSSGIAQREVEELAPLLKRVQKQTGCTMFVIEHDHDLVAATCDEIVVVEQGRIAAPKRAVRSSRASVRKARTQRRVATPAASGKHA